jgi:hypothetical protein
MVFYEQRITQLTVVPVEDGRAVPIYDDRAMTVQVDDEGAGEYLVVTDNGTTEKIRIDEEVWDSLRGSIDKMFVDIRRRRERHNHSAELA